MSGSSSIVEMINQKTKEKEQEIIKEANRHRDLKMQEAKRQADEMAQKIIRKAEAEVKSELLRYEASAKLKSKYKILEAKDNLIQSVMDAVTEELKNFVGKARYKKVLTRLAVEGGEALEVDKLELIVPDGHSKYLEVAKIQTQLSKAIGKKTEVAVSKETVRSIGGVVVRTADGAKWVDNSFDARLERMDSTIRDKISSMLFKNGKEK